MKHDANQTIDSLQQWIEPHFEFAGHNRLSIESACDPANQIDYLSNLISANRKNIIAHVRKIVLVRETSGESNRIFAAIVDFFGSLQDKGFAIKKRLLATCQSKLEENQFNYLVSTLKNNVIEKHHLLESAQAWLLFDFITPNVGIRLEQKQQRDADSNETDLKHEVSDYLENSQIELAIELLENALIQNPKMIEMGELLMQLYKGSDNKSRFTRLFDRLVNNSDSDTLDSLPAFWNETIDYFNKQGSAQ